MKGLIIRVVALGLLALAVHIHMKHAIKETKAHSYVEGCFDTVADLMEEQGTPIQSNDDVKAIANYCVTKYKGRHQEQK